MKKVLFPILALVLAVGLAIPMAAPAAAITTDTIVSDANTEYWSWGPDSTWGTGDDTWEDAVPCWTHTSWVGIAPAGATWIWTTYQIVPATEYNTLPPEGYRTFKRTFEIPSGSYSITGSISINADNAYVLLVNGTVVDSEGAMSRDGPDTMGWQTLRTTPLTNLVVGTNTIEVHALNYFNTGSGTSNPAAVVFSLTAEYEEFEPAPAIETTKSADKDWVMHGDSITYTYEVENTGNVDLAPPSVTDSLGITVSYVSGDGVVVGVFDVDEVWVFGATYAVPTHDDEEDNPILDTATATAYLETTPITDDSDEVSVDIIHLTDLTPLEAYNLVGAEHCVTATISPEVAGVDVSFEVTGANPTTPPAPPDPTETTNGAGGEATYCYNGANTGIDTIKAYLDGNGNGSYDEGESTTDPVTKYWFLNFVTGGGTIKDGRKPAWNLSGNVGYFELDSTIHGQFNIIDHVGKMQYHCHDEFSSLIFYGGTAESPEATWDTAEFTGTFYDKDGTPHVLTIVIEDNGEPGKGVDTITVSGVPTILETIIDGGNYQVHEGYKG